MVNNRSSQSGNCIVWETLHGYAPAITDGYMQQTYTCTSLRSFTLTWKTSSTLQVSTNGVVSFGEEFTYPSSVLFPSSTVAGIHFSYVLAPYWSDIDTRQRGEVWYETHIRNQNSTSDELLNRVSSFVNNQTNASRFEGTSMIVATWDSVPPYAGEGVTASSPLVSDWWYIPHI